MPRGHASTVQTPGMQQATPRRLGEERRGAARLSEAWTSHVRQCVEHRIKTVHITRRVRVDSAGPRYARATPLRPPAPAVARTWPTTAGDAASGRGSPARPTEPVDVHNNRHDVLLSC